MKLLVSDLSPKQIRRLTDLASLIDADGFIKLANAIQVVTDSSQEGARLTTFRKFRQTVRSAALEAGLAFELAVDSSKSDLETRRCWFSGEDMAENRLAGRSMVEASRGSLDATISPQVREVLNHPVTICVVSHYEEPAAHKVKSFVEALTVAAAIRSDLQWKIMSTAEVALGTDRVENRDKLIQASTLTVALVSPTILQDKSLLAAVQLSRPPVLVPFAPLPAGNLDMGGLRREHLLGNPPWCAAARSGRDQLIDDVIRAIVVELDRVEVINQPSRASAQRGLADWVRIRSTRQFDASGFIPGEMQETSLQAAEYERNSNRRQLGSPAVAIDRLVEWALDRSSPPICALLGDLGTGKTTTTKMLTKTLLEHTGPRDERTLPLYFDLRDLPLDAIRNRPSLSQIVHAMLRATQGVEAAPPDVEDVLSSIRAGSCLVIFDGLDEVLVHLPPSEQQQFTRMLWRVLETGSDPRHRESLYRPTKLLLTCRTHFFRSIRDEVSHFSGQDREAASAQRYVAFLMVPFEEKQIRDYLTANVPGLNVDGALQIIDDTHNLRELASRPLTLRMIVEQLSFVEQARLDGVEVRAYDLYGAIVHRWLARDDGKHSLLPEHKLVLMEYLAAFLWSHGLNSWDASSIENWLLTFLRDHPKLELHYSQRIPDLWKDDLRTATFLVRRDDDSFEFAHTSLREYFLARYLASVLMQPANPGTATALSMKIPSRETFEFLGQALAGAEPADQGLAIETLTWVSLDRSLDSKQARSLIFAYALVALADKYPAHALRGVCLDDVDLSTSGIAYNADQSLDLSRASFRNANLRGVSFGSTNFDHADFSRADLSFTDFQECNLDNAYMTAANLTGAIFRRCSARALETTDACLYRAQIILPTNPPQLGNGWLGLESPRPNSAMSLRSVARPNEVLSISYSPDGKYLATATTSGANLMDALTGECIAPSLGGLPEARAVAFSPDGSKLAIGGERAQGIKILDVGDGSIVLDLPGSSFVNDLKFTPDGNHLAIAAFGSSRVVDIRTGLQIFAVPLDLGTVRSVDICSEDPVIAFGCARGFLITDLAGTVLLSREVGEVTSVSLDAQGDRIVVGGPLGTKVFMVPTGAEIFDLSQSVSNVGAVVFDPSSTRVAIASMDGRRRGNAGCIFNLQNGVPEQRVTANIGHFNSLAYSPDGSTLTLGSTSGLHSVNTKTFESKFDFDNDWEYPTTIKFDPSGRKIVIVSEGVRTLRASDGVELSHFGDNSDLLVCAQISLDGLILAVGGYGAAGLIDAATGDVLHDISEDLDNVFSLGFNSIDDYVAFSGLGSTTLVKTKSGVRLRTVQHNLDGATDVVVNQDATLVAVSGGDRLLVIDLTDGRVRYQFKIGYVEPKAFSADGKYLSVDSVDGPQILALHNASQTMKLPQLTYAVDKSCFSPDGSLLALGGTGGVYLFDLPSSTLTRISGLPGDRVLAIDFSPDGRRLAISGTDVQVFVLSSGKFRDWIYQPLPNSQWVRWKQRDRTLIEASYDAWRSLGWVGFIDGSPVRLPAESFGPLPGPTKSALSESTK